MKFTKKFLIGSGLQNFHIRIALVSTSFFVHYSRFMKYKHRALDI